MMEGAAPAPFNVIDFPGSVDRFHECIEVDDKGCWIWKGPRFSKNGYGRFYFDGRELAAHRFAYQLYVRPIGPSRVLDHRCAEGCDPAEKKYRRRCCNPEHLEPISGVENNRRGDSVSAQNARKKVCPKCRRKYVRRPDGRRVCINRKCPGRVKRK